MTNLEKQYNDMLIRVGNGGYDGRGKGVDVYSCEHGHKFYTRYRDKGVTPFCIKCRECQQPTTATHRDTITEQIASTINAEVHNWVRPTLEQMAKLSEAAREHVLNGGLVLEEEIADRGEEEEISRCMSKIAENNPKTRIVVIAEGKSKEQIGTIVRYARKNGLEVMIETNADIKSVIDNQLKRIADYSEQALTGEDLQRFFELRPPEVRVLPEVLPTIRNRRERRAWERQQKKNRKNR